MAMSIQHWVKTQEAIEIIESQRVFCIGGELWQGFQRTPIRVHEAQLDDFEIDSALDIDSTLDKVRTNRRNRIEGRNERKRREYSDRRQELRQQRTSIRSSIKEAKDMGIPVSQDDLAALEEIERRMQRLIVLDKELKDEPPVEVSEPPPVYEPDELETGRVKCLVCGEQAPEGHKRPKAWLRGHTMGKHKAKK